MRKHLLASAALLLGAVAFSAPAAADVFVRADVTFDKDVFVTEQLFIRKDVFIFVDAFFEGNSAAESVTVINQANNDNVIDFTSGDLGDRLFADLLATISASINENVGITQVNQDVGNANNQANSVSAAVSVTQAFFAESMIEVEQYTINNSVTTDGTATFDGQVAFTHANKAAFITGSINDNVGITQVNQSAGNANNQLNAVDIGIGANSAVALSEAALGQTNTGNLTDEVATVRTSQMVGSVNNNAGITSVNQTSGNMNNQATVISIAGAITAPNSGIRSAVGFVR
jgi:hypothetical protein